MDPLDSIAGWFSFGKLYDRVVAEAPPGSLLIEVGVWQGRSLCHLARAAKKADKGLRVVGVDWCCGSQDNDLLAMTVQAQPYKNMASLALWNIYRFGLGDVCSLLCAESAVANQLFANGSAWMVFIDGSHDAESVARDVMLWRPVVHDNGILCGHDAKEFQVQLGLEKAGVDWEFSPEDEQSWVERRIL